MFGSKSFWRLRLEERYLDAQLFSGPLQPGVRRLVEGLVVDATGVRDLASLEIDLFCWGFVPAPARIVAVTFLLGARRNEQRQDQKQDGEPGPFLQNRTPPSPSSPT